MCEKIPGRAGNIPALNQLQWPVDQNIQSSHNLHRDNLELQGAK